jgi:AcrR family transcriptional regulator
VLAAAAAAVAAVGPAAVTLAEIGARAGLAPATLLQRFGSKRGLLLALARHDAHALPHRLSLAATADAPVAALIDTFGRLAAGVRTSAEFANHLAFLMLDLTDPEFQQISRDYARAVETAIASALEASRAAGELTTPAGDQAQLARAVHAAYNGALVTWGMTGEGGPSEQVTRQLRQLLTPHLAQAPPSR